MIEVQTAAERGDEEALREIVPGALDAMFKDDRLGGVLLSEYVNMMIDDGEAQAALDYIESFFPGVSDIAGNAASDWKSLNIQMDGVIPLLKELQDDAAFRQSIEAFAANWHAAGISLDERSYSHFWMEYHLNGLDAGKKAFFSTFDEDRYILA